MLKINRSLVASAVLGCFVPLAAQASTLSLNFEDLAAAVTSAGVAGYALTSNQYPGIQIINDCPSGSGSSCIAPTAFSGSSPAGSTGNGGVYVLGSAFTINILSGFQFDALSLSLFDVSGGGGSVGSVVATLTTSTGVDINVVSSGSGTSWLDNFDALNGANLGDIQSIHFTQAVAIDNLKLTYSGTTSGGGTGGGSTGGAVPEPASFGLAALALLGAGISRRKRQS